MKILHVFRHPPDAVTRKLVSVLSQDREAMEFSLHEELVDYYRLLDLIINHDQVVSWW